MGADLPALSRAEFARRLRRCSPQPLADRAEGALFAHYEELRRWNRRLSLVGPGTADAVVERHYGEALAALPLIEPARSLLDVGSGGGFPGLVLAAVRPDLDLTLVEARQRKWAFLQSALRKAELSCQCLNARVGAALEIPPVDLVTWRAVRLPATVVEELAAASARMLVWSGADEPQPPAGWRPGRRVALAGSDRRRIVEWLPEERET